MAGDLLDGCVCGWIRYGEADGRTAMLVCLPGREVVHGAHMRRHLVERLFLLDIEPVAFPPVGCPVVGHFLPPRIGRFDAAVCR